MKRLCWAILGLVVVAAFLLTYRIGAKDFWDASEARPAQSAREMRERGDWLVPYTNGAVDLTKPPVYAWLAGAAFALLGESEGAARWPSLLATAGILLVVSRIGRRVGGPWTAVLAPLLLVTTTRFLWQARLAEIETLLALGVTVSWWGLARALDEERPSVLSAALFHLGLGFGLAVKGPVVFLLVVPAAIVATVWTGRARLWRSVPFLAGIQLVVVVGLAWYLAVVLRDPEALSTFLSYARGENVGHLRDPLYYLVQGPMALLPWTPLVALGLALPLQRGTDPDLQRRLRLPVAAFAVTFVVMSLLNAKQTHYLIPTFPMAAVLAAAALEVALAKHATRWLRFSWVGCALAVAGAGAALAAWRFVPSVPMPDDAFVRSAALPVGAAALALGLLAAAWRGARAVATALLALVLVEAFAAGHVAAAYDPVRSARPLMERVAARVAPEAPLHSTVFGSHSDHIWYLRRTVQLSTPKLVRFWLGTTSEPWYAIVLADEAKAIGDRAHVLLEEPAFQKRRRHVVLVSNAAGAEGP